MLRPSRLLAAAVLPGALISSQGVAFAGKPPTPPPIVVDTDNHGGVVDTSVTDIGAPAHRSRGASLASRRSGSHVTCKYTEMLIPTSLTVEVRDGVPGQIYWLDCSNGLHSVAWVPHRRGPTAPPRVSAGQLAQQAVNQLALPAPDVHYNPNLVDGRIATVVGVPTWFWVTAASYRTLAQTTAAGGVWARVVARPARTEWQTGTPDARNIVCNGPGTAYNPSQPTRTSACTTTYMQSSAHEPQRGPDPNNRYFVATVTTVWQVSWTGNGGARGTLPEIRRQTTFLIAVAEVQAVNQ
jgi:hypothetical protein